MKKIIFKNKCPIPEWLPDNKKEFRDNADEFFNKIIYSTPIFQDKEVELEYFQQGVGSVVAKVTLDDGEIYVIKTTEGVNPTIAEIKSYEAMRDNGVKVPEVYAEGVIDEHPFFVMEYFKEGTLQDKLNNGEKDVEEIAEIKAEVFVNLKKISGSGYGWTIGYEDGVLKGNFSDIKSFMDEWFDGDDTIDVASKNYPSVDWRNELDKHKNKVISENKDNVTKFGSFDFQTTHFFATEPPTFFDSNPRLEPEYFDLAFALMPSVGLSDDKQVLRKALITKYKDKLGVINKEDLLCAIWLQTFRKAANLLLKPDEGRTKLGLSMLDVLSKEGELEKHLKQYL